MKHRKKKRKHEMQMDRLARAEGLRETIQSEAREIREIFGRICRKHNNDMKAVWVEFNSYLDRNGKIKTKKALKEAANRMSSMSTGDAVKMLKDLGFESRSKVEVVVRVNIGEDNISIVMPQGKSHTLRNRDYAIRILCAVVGCKGKNAFDYLQDTIGDKATKGLFKNAASELTAF